ncbi:MAG: hypothetical protein AAF485_02585 [Chloroflexota bacterium]
MKRFVYIICIIFAVSLAVVIGIRLSADALAVVMGVVLGILATIPTAGLVAYIFSRQFTRVERMPYQMSPQQPPVVVVNGTEQRASSNTLPALPAPTSLEPTRKWTVIGDVETEQPR